MSYDLYFQARPTVLKPRADEFVAYFRQRKHFQVTEQQAVYQNETTGVYFVFDFRAPGIEGEDDLLPVSFNLNYVRPHIFGLEAEPEVRTFVAQFNLLVSDPQISGMGDGEYSTGGFLSGWNAGNELGYKSITEADLAETPATLPTVRIEACWRWNHGRDGLQRKCGEDLFVPRFMFLERGGRVVTAVVWPDAIPIVIPEADVVFIPREAILPKGFFRAKQDIAIVTWNEISPLLQQFPLQHGVLPYRQLQYGDPPSQVLSQLRAFRATKEEPAGIGVDHILNAELLAKVRKP